jgi:hypothetical protein
MLDKKKIELYPDKLLLEESNGHLCLNIFLNYKQENLLIKLNHSEIECLSTELNLVQQKFLIASEYEK